MAQIKTTTSNQSAIITLTDKAGKRIAHLASKEKKTGACLRIKVKGGGCSGLKYEYIFPAFDANEKNDQIIKNQSGILAIDYKSLEYMKDSIIDYVDTIAYSGFEVKNPLATANCGCGNSFDV